MNHSPVILVMIILSLASCMHQKRNINANQSTRETLKEPMVMTKSKLLMYASGSLKESYIKESDLNQLSNTVLEIYRSSEPMRLYLEDETLEEMMSTATGFAIAFDPYIAAETGADSVSYILFLKEGQLGNDNNPKQIIFFVALNGEPLIRSPFVSEQGVVNYQHLLNLIKAD
ncbi:MAG TPA: hypothetical protein PKE03_12600 [Bacteroidales bacterium]|nr:hypothetical protein [Bacteroidales bacterium]